ncbi:hypothetical protein DdX_12034 [Ditylenchus destructor]|uniref:Uncharacterized protein n=1 Tax=Ditylenchus destructor TaxID=166010 RepID=A0AAD4MWA3_9BILA|nr:hypothetical protein DdX_12034 [Ditylenchus destructor]
MFCNNFFGDNTNTQEGTNDSDVQAELNRIRRENEELKRKLGQQNRRTFKRAEIKQRMPRPRLNVRSNFLIYMHSIPTDINYKTMKNDIVDTVGGLSFIETFQGWKKEKNIGHAVLEFINGPSLDNFVDLLERGEFFKFTFKYEILDSSNRDEFFSKINANTNVDLLECDGIPPASLRDVSQSIRGNNYGNQSRHKPY